MLYRFNIELSDIDRGVYESLDFRIAQHPSETGPYLLSRVLAYALSYQEGIEFTPGGLADPEAPALRVVGGLNTINVWIEIGNPSARKLHKASKTAKKVIVYTYKSPDVLVQEIRANEVHRANEIKIFAIDPKFLAELETHIEKNNRWSILVQQGQIDVNTGKQSLITEVKDYSFTN
jgi:uncharacterized protein YaeQ